MRDHCILDKHKIRHKLKTNFQCDVCNLKFLDRRTLKSHRETHSEPRQYTCKICKESFDQNDALRIHREIHKGERLFQCEFCEKAFAHLIHLTYHKRTHTGEKPYQCELCNKSFSRAYLLKKHKKKHHKNKDKLRHPEIFIECDENIEVKVEETTSEDPLNVEIKSENLEIDEKEELFDGIKEEINEEKNFEFIVKNEEADVDHIDIVKHEI